MNLKNSKIIYLAFLGLWLLLSCQQPASTESTKKSARSIALTTDSSSTGEVETPSERKAPNTVIAEIQAKIDIVESPLVKDNNLKFPLLTVDKGNSDFVQIIRCNATYDMVTGSGLSVRHAMGTSTSLDEFQYAWTQALNDHRHCKLITNHMSTKQYSDMTVPDGNYYYVINPCLIKDNSLSFREACSYNITLSDIFSYKNLLSVQIQENAIRLADAQAELDALFHEVKSLTSHLILQIRACENMVAHDQAVNAQKRGLVSAGFLATSIAIFGLNMGVMAFMMGGGMIGLPLLNDKLAIQNLINTCTGGEEMVAEMAQRGQISKEMQMGSVSKIRAGAKKYEDEFGVKKTLDRLDELCKEENTDQNGTVTSPGGAIIKAGRKMQQILREMNGLDSRINTLDADIIKTANYIKEQGGGEAVANGSVDFESIINSLGK